MLQHILNVIDSISEWTGKVVSFFILIVTFVILYEVVSRYIFHSPTIWALEVSLAFYGIYVVFIGAYVLRVGQHVNVDILYGRFSLRVKAIIDLVTWLLFFLWVGTIIWKGWEVGWSSFVVKEREPTTFGCPVYPIKLSIPIGASLLFLQGLAGYIRNILIIISEGKGK